MGLLDGSTEREQICDNALYGAPFGSLSDVERSISSRRRILLSRWIIRLGRGFDAS